MSTITTFKRIRMDPADPQRKDIDIEDIAHALSLLCRGGGHLDSFFSVAQHCINCAGEAAIRGYSRTVQLACLLHDASEAYLADITRPVKRLLPEYMAIEEKLQEMIWDIYLGRKLTETENIQIREIDDAQLYYEMLTFMDERISGCAPNLYSVPDFGRKDFSIVEQQFLALFRTLADQQNGLPADP